MGVAPLGIDGTPEDWMGSNNEPIEAYQQLQARIDLFDESVVLTQYAGGEPVSCYEVAPDDLAAAFAARPLATGRLPRNTIFYAEEAGQQRIGLFLPAKVRKLPLTPLAQKKSGFERDSALVPLPPLIFVGCGRAYWLYAVKAYPDDDGARLYRAPLPNVHDDGKICQGNADFPVASTKTIRDAVAAFFTSKFNTHLINGKSTQYTENVLAAWKAAAQEDAWPLEDLVLGYGPGRVGELWQ
jgi:hypothetical protein